MKTRLLPQEEWAKLHGTEAEAVVPFLAALGGHALVVEEGDDVIGTWLLLPEWRAECLWIAPAHRGKASVGRRLLAAMATTARSLGIARVITGSCSPLVDRLLTRIGATKIPGTHFVIPVGRL